MAFPDSVAVTERIVPDVDLGVTDLVDINGQLFFVYKYEYENEVKELCLPLLSMIEMKAVYARRNDMLADDWRIVDGSA